MKKQAMRKIRKFSELKNQINEQKEHHFTRFKLKFWS